MNVMSLDAEYNQPSGKTIQIGAAIFNSRTAELVARIELIVNPNEPINPEITELTGIRDQDVQNGMTIIEAYDELRAFHKKHKAFKNPIVWGSGNSNDSAHIYAEYRKANLQMKDESFLQEDNFMGFRVLDVKTIYQSVQLHTNSEHGGGLAKSMAKFGLTFEGESHRALTDAMNAFRFWYYLVKVFHDGKK